MVKRMARYSAVLMAFAVLFAGCNGGDDDESSDVDKLIGSWSWSELVIKGITVDWDQLKVWSENPSGELTWLTAGGSTTITPARITQMGGTISANDVTFNADHTVTGTGGGSVPGEPPRTQTETATWSVSGDKLTITATDAEGKTLVFTATWGVSGRTLTIAISNQQFMQMLRDGGVDLSQLDPDLVQLLQSLSATIKFTRK